MNLGIEICFQFKAKRDRHQNKRNYYKISFKNKEINKEMKKMKEILNRRKLKLINLIKAILTLTYFHQYNPFTKQEDQHNKDML